MPIGAGWTSPAVGSHVYEHGASVNIEAYANVGAIFDHWDVTFIQSGVTIPTDSWFDTIPMTEDIQAIAYFNIINHYLTISTTPEGSGSVTPESGEYQSGSLVLLTAYPNVEWHFSHWDINGNIITGNPIQVLIQSGTQVVANFSVGTEFEPGSVHTAKATMTNPTNTGFDYEAYLYMGIDLAVVSASFFHLNADESKQAEFSVVMPATPGIYPVHLGIFSGGQNIALYKADEDVIIVAPAIFDPNIKYISFNYWTQGSIPSDFLINSRQTATVGPFATYISETYMLEVVLLKNGEIKASGFCQFYFQDSNASYTAINIDNFVLPSEPGEYDVQIRTYRGGQLTGIYPEGKLIVYPITEPSDLAFQNLVFSLPQYSGLIWHYLDVECDIVNTGNETITREVSLLLHYHDYTAKYGHWWRVVTGASYYNLGRVTLTLAPGASFHYHYAGTTVGRGESCIELRDDMGGISEYKCAGW